MTTRPKPLDRQVGEERARHPSVGDATRYGVRFGLLIGSVSIAADVGSRFVNDDRTPRPSQSWQQWLLGAVVGLAVGILFAVLVMQVGAAVMRWRRRVALRFWYPDRAA